MLRVDKVKDRATEDGRFQPGNPMIGLLPTRVSAEWLNAVQEEIVNVVQGRGIHLDPNNSSQLLQAVLDIYSYGVNPQSFPILNGVQVPTDLPLDAFDSTHLKAVFFHALSTRHTTKADMSFFSSHVAVFNGAISSWTLLTQFDPALFRISIPVPQSSPGAGNPSNPTEIKPNFTQAIGPHFLSLSATGQLQYQTSLLDGDNHQGILSLTHFQYVRI